MTRAFSIYVFFFFTKAWTIQQRGRSSSFVLGVCPSCRVCCDWAERSKGLPLLWQGKYNDKNSSFLRKQPSSKPLISPCLNSVWVLFVCLLVFLVWHDALKSEHEATASFCSILCWYLWSSAFTSGHHCSLWPRGYNGPQKSVGDTTGCSVR